MTDFKDINIKDRGLHKRKGVRLLSSTSVLTIGAALVILATSSQSAMAQSVRTSTIGQPTSPVDITTSDFGGNVDTDTLEREIRNITGMILLSNEEQQRRIEQATSDSTGRECSLSTTA